MSASVQKGAAALLCTSCSAKCPWSRGKARASSTIAVAWKAADETGNTRRRPRARGQCTLTMSSVRVDDQIFPDFSFGTSSVSDALCSYYCGTAAPALVRTLSDFHVPCRSMNIRDAMIAFGAGPYVQYVWAARLCGMTSRKITLNRGRAEITPRAAATQWFV